MDHSQTQIDQESRPPSAVNIRALLIVVFAILLLVTAGFAKATEPEATFADNEATAQGGAQTTIQYDGITHVVAITGHTAESRAAIDARRDAIDQRKASRPKYTEMVVSLANFDSDADPDGWRVELVLLDQQDRPVIARANATFELMPRVLTADYFNYVDAAMLPVRWSMNLTFDQDGVARVKLPLRESLRPLFGWPSAIFPRQSDRSRMNSSVTRRISGTWRSRSVVTDEWQNGLGRPTMGEIRVRVSVPTEGVFEAASFVPIRPPALVDTFWPYR